MNHNVFGYPGQPLSFGLAMPGTNGEDATVGRGVNNVSAHDGAARTSLFLNIGGVAAAPTYQDLLAQMILCAPGSIRSFLPQRALIQSPFLIDHVYHNIVYPSYPRSSGIPLRPSSPVTQPPDVMLDPKDLEMDTVFQMCGDLFLDKPIASNQTGAFTDKLDEDDAMHLLADVTPTISSQDAEHLRREKIIKELEGAATAVHAVDGAASAVRVLDDAEMHRFWVELMSTEKDVEHEFAAAASSATQTMDKLAKAVRERRPAAADQRPSKRAHFERKKKSVSWAPMRELLPEMKK